MRRDTLAHKLQVFGSHKLGLKGALLLLLFVFNLNVLAVILSSLTLMLPLLIKLLKYDFMLLDLTSLSVLLVSFSNCYWYLVTLKEFGLLELLVHSACWSKYLRCALRATSRFGEDFGCERARLQLVVFFV